MMASPIPSPILRTRDEFAVVLSYDPDTGEFTWIDCGQTRRNGTRAGSINNVGYRRISIHRTSVAEHRLAFLFMTGQWPDHAVDHIDGNRTNNKWCNLRAATAAQNAINRLSVGTPSGYRGVYRRKRSWVAQVSYHGNTLRAIVPTIDLAIRAYNAMAREFHGEFAILHHLNVESAA